MHTDCGIAGVMRGELTKKRESTFPPSGFWVGGLGEEVGPMMPWVGARGRVGSPVWNLRGTRRDEQEVGRKPPRLRQGWAGPESTRDLRTVAEAGCRVQPCGGAASRWRGGSLGLP